MPRAPADAPSGAWPVASPTKGRPRAKHAKKGGLRAKIFGAQNPVTTQPAKAYAGMQEELKAASRAAEAALAEQLRAAGHAVHYG